jgi:malonyl-CoA O-methyltransferase
MNTKNELHKTQIRAAFNRAATVYADHADWQKIAGKDLINLLSTQKIAAKRIADMGCGTGFIIDFLHKLYPYADHYAIDLAENMLQILQASNSSFRLINADVDQLPFQDQAFDLITSNLTFQWCAQLDVTLAEMHRVLSSNGWLFFTTLGPKTLEEAKQLSQKFNFDFSVRSFVDPSAIPLHLNKDQWELMHCSSKMLEVSYPSIFELMQHLKYVGSQHPQKQKGLSGREKIQHLFNTPLDVTYEILFVACRKI